MIDIKSFCAIGDIRDVLNAPFVFENKIVASNGHIMVIVPNDGNNEYAHCPSNFNVKRLIDIVESPSEWTACNKSEIVFPEKIVCAECIGSGKLERKECEECDGEGEVDLENDYSTYYGLECKSCGGDGYILNKSTDKTCSVCAGAGNVDGYMSAVEILGLKIQVKYLRLIMDEENLEFAANDEKDMLIYRCGTGISGAIMSARV